VTERLLKFQVKCPICGESAVNAVSVTQAKESLAAGTPIRAYAECHDWTWDLKEDERAALGQKLA
jgi:hypothetical protein